MTFALHRITSDVAKFRYIIIHLDNDLRNIVGDLIDTPPQTSKYETVKRRIIDALSESKETKLRRLLRGQAIGDEKPSVFLQRLRNLASGQCSDDILRSLFMEQMPENVRGILAISQLDDLNLLAVQADRIVEALRPKIASIEPGLSNITAIPETKTSTPIRENQSRAANTDDNITARELKMAIETLERKFERALRSRSRSRGRRISRTRPLTPSKRGEPLCYYHQKFGPNARKCRYPCAWEKQPSDQGN